jgi:hypothetical protein
VAIRNRQRTLVWALVIAIVIGFAFGWFARLWSESTPESRIRDVAGGIRERVREFTH